MNVEELKRIFSKNLIYYIKSRGTTQTKLANELNIPKMTISNWVNGNTYPRPDKIQILADYFDIRRSDLQEEHDSSNVYETAGIYLASNETVKIPILGEIACGDPLYAEENFNGYKTSTKHGLPSGNVYYLKAKGDSMHPTIPQGAYVLIREQRDVENGEIAAVLLNENTEATLKRIRKVEGNIMLMPDNRSYDPIIVSQNNPCKIIGKAIRYTQDL